MWGLVANWLAGTVGEWIKAQAGIAITRAEARAQAVSQGIPGYSDEYLVFVWSLPIIGVFIPGVEQHISAGFAQLKMLPDWYIAGFITISFAVFGIDKLFKIQGK